MPFDDEDPPYVELDPAVNSLSHDVIGAAIEVHRQLGPGLDDALYDAALRIELAVREIQFQRQVCVQVAYRGEVIGERRLDFVVGKQLVVEIKAVEHLSPLHHAQVQTYLRLTRLQLGLLINFNTPLLRDGIKRVICPRHAKS